ncbi:Tuftelin-interacting protein 11 [Nibea albiflora]|uniref:Tuftelin-interacting protein 11 n=1 Tax=Nibea albiflora TaxID=240163 RepID=A0ACB7FC84_NIBAL|nr:Tuftelin-interacting protein 11 [Nibea albiflora]
MSMSHLYGRREEEEDGVEVESFEVTDWDLANEFNPDRRRHRQTKEQATYGIWADRDSDEDERPSFGGKKSKDYTAPGKLCQWWSAVISGGTSPQRFAGGIQTGKGIGNWEKHTKGIGQKLLQKMGYQPGKGLGKNAQGIVNPIEAKVRKGKGAVGAYGNERTQQSLQDFPVVDSEEEEEKEFQKELGQWRKDPAGPGGKKKPKYSYRTVDELKAKGKLAGRTIAASAGELAQVKVIDMTGREQKVYYSYSQMTNKHSVPDEGPPSMSTQDQKGSGFALPELEHNLQLLIDLTEQDILQSARRLQHEKDVVVSLNHESRALQSRLDAEQDAIQRMEAVLALVERFPSGEMAPGEGPTLQECARIFETLQTDYYEEYKSMGLADLAVAVVQPLLKEKLRSWDPLKDSSYCLEDIGQWRAILESRDLHSSGPDSNMDPYHRLLWEVWIPVMRSCVSSWQPRIVGPMVDCIDVWAPLLPLWILDHLLEQLILPRLQREVDSWNPLTDTVPIHSWIHPWLPLLQSRLEPLYPPIRSKLSNALQRWHPSDASARLILQPWKDVFTPGAWEAFMVKNIIPKLALCLEELVINPHQQQMEPFHWVMDWEGMLSPSSLVSLLDKNFFTKWLQVLCSWLSNSPNYEEITKWYLGWKSMFSDVLLAQPLIKEKFNEALDIMNRAVSSGMGGYMQPGARENIAYLTQTERRKDFQYEAMQERRDAESLLMSDALKKRKSKVLRNEGGTPEMVKRGRGDGDQQDVRVYSEEVELDGRDPEQDYLQYKESCESLATLMSEIQDLKANGAKEGCAEVEQRRMQSCIHFMNLKKLNRLAHMRLKRGRDQTHEAKQRVDVLHLQLQNLLYEVLHLQKEISKCLEFKSKHEEIDLVSEEEFYQGAPSEISRPQHTKNDPHQLTLARLDWELEQRKRLAEKYKESQATKEKIQKSIEVKKEHLTSLQPGLNAIMQASLPVQQYLSMPFEQTQKQTEIARHLPPPLYVLFVQANAYGQACDKNLCVSISGDVDEAKALSKPPEDSQDDESDSDAEEEQEKTKRRRPTTGGQLDDKRREMLKRHPLSLCLDLKCKDGSILHLFFYYLMNLNIMTVKTKVSTSTDLSTAISAGDLLKADTLLSCLYTNDQGRETPNPANRYQFDKVGIVCFADYVEELGHPYTWVQTLGGLHFPRDASEAVRVGSSLSASQMESTMKLLRGRVQSRLALHKQFASLEHSIIPVSSECQHLFPAKIMSRLARWTTITQEEYMALPYTRHVSDAGLAKETDLYFMAVVERGTARLQAAVVLSPRYPEISPLFSLSLSWKGERSGRADDNLRAMESEVNVFKNELQGPRPGHQLLTNQISRLCVCLDVYLETESQDDGVEGPREFPREKMCLRTVRGPNRLKPFKYNHPQGFFSHR